MNKFLKYLIIFLVLIAVLAVVLMAVSPSKLVFERSETIDAPPAMVYNIVNDLKKWESWSPFAKLDPDAKLTYTNKTEGVGAKFTWDGNEKMGKGTQYILETESPKSIKLGLTFDGFDGESISDWSFEKQGEQTHVTWGYSGGETPFYMRPFNLLMKSGLSKTYDEGLDNMKEIVEERAMNKVYDGFKMNEVYVGKKHYVMNRQVVKMSDIGQFFSKNLGSLFIKAQGEEIEMDGMPSGLFYSWDEASGTTDMAVAIPLKELQNLPGSISQSLPDGKAVQVDYYGDSSKTVVAHEAIDAYLKDHGLLVNFPIIEEYVTDPATEKDPAKWLTKITYYVTNSTQ